MKKQIFFMMVLAMAIFYPCLSSAASLGGYKISRYDLGQTNYYEPGSTVKTDITSYKEQWHIMATGGVTVRTGDINGDRKTELVYTDGTSLVVLNGNGKELLRVATNATLGILADINKDGADEMILSQSEGNTGKIYAYNKDGSIVKTFSSDITPTYSGWGASLWPVLASDINNDGNVEVVAAKGTGYGLQPRGIVTFDSATQNELWYYSVGPFPSWICAGNVTGDSKQEIVFGSGGPANGSSANGTNDSSCYTWCLSSTAVRLWLASYEGSGFVDSSVAVSDMDGNGSNDIVATSFSHGWSEWQGSYGRVYVLDPTTGNPLRQNNFQKPVWMGGLADLNNDGKKEIVVCYKDASTQQGKVVGLDFATLNPVTSTFAVSGTGASNINVAAITDLNGDGKKEVIVQTETTCYILDNQLNQKLAIPMPVNTSSVFVTDINNDGAVDLVFYGGNEFYVYSVKTMSFPPINLRASVGRTKAFLEWSFAPVFDEYRFKIKKWTRTSNDLKNWSTWDNETIIDNIDGEQIYSPRAIISDLVAKEWVTVCPGGITGCIDVLVYNQYKFAVVACDASGNDISNWSNSVVVQPADKPANITVPTNPIVLVPGVGSTLDKDNFFTEVRSKFGELGWQDAAPATVSYSGNYAVGIIPAGVAWYQSKEPTDYSKPSVFTFVPYRPAEPNHEIGIEQKGIELGYFLRELGYKGKSNFQLVGHSLGGLTCRAYLQRLQGPVTYPNGEPVSYKNNVVRLVTTGTPNNGVMEDNAGYTQKGVKDILLNGYTQDSWRFSVFKSHGWKDTRTKDYLTGLIDFLEYERSCHGPLGSFRQDAGGGWDFDGKTLKDDVLYNSKFMQDISDGSGGIFGALPNIRYVNIIGEIAVFKQQNHPALASCEPAINNDLWYPAGNNSFLGYGDLSGNSGDGIVSTDSQNLKTVFPNSSVRVFTRNVNHQDEEKDFGGIMMGLDYPVLSITANCPVDLEITSPSGQVITKDFTNVFLAEYSEKPEDNDANELSDTIEIPFPEDGEYTIEVIPDSNADPNAAYSLIAARGETTTVLADNVRIADIPQEPYQAAGDTAPIANAGPDQTVYAWIDGVAEVELDGLASNDPDGDTLTYKWTWTVDSNTYEANSVSPTIELPVGVHTIQLIVNDGIADSVPDDINITVIAPLKSKLQITPCILNRDNCDRHKHHHKPENIIANVRLPEGITKKDIDDNEPLTIYPGGIETSKQWIFSYYEGQHRHRKLLTAIWAYFDRDDILDAIPTNGKVELKAAGKLKTGQYFFGSDTVKIISRHPCDKHNPCDKH